MQSEQPNGCDTDARYPLGSAVSTPFDDGQAADCILLQTDSAHYQL